MTPWTRRNFARWLFEDYPRAMVVTPRRWHHGMFTGPGAYCDPVDDPDRPDDRVVCIDLGLRATAVSIAERLTAGQVTVIDVYNPQSNPGTPLRRGRGRARKPDPDPRLDWIDGSIQLLPLPDRSVRLVFMNQILSEFWLPEERAELLEEVRRILVPEGRLLLAERNRGRSNLLFTGLVTSAWPPAETWRDSLIKADFRIQREESVRGLVYCVRADKPPPTAGKQMRLQLEFL